jgi:flagellar protein FliO/FliZ
MIFHCRTIFAWWCVVLMTGSSLAAADENRLIVPGATTHSDLPADHGVGGARITTLIGVLVLAGAGAWILYRGRGKGLIRNDARLLTVNETRSLGNRQFLVVASYEDKKFLLGVCPGKIELLSRLSEAAPEEKSR